MKKFIVIAVSAFVAAPALAADVAVLRPVPGTEYYGYYKGPPRPLAVSWTGCYLGGHVGGAIANYDETNGSFVVPVTIPHGFGPVPPPSSVGFGLDSVHLSSGSGVIGGQAGCNLDLGSKWLIGVEGDAAWTRITNGRLFTGTTTVSGTPITNNGVTTTPGTIRGL
jgi:outer membrane immunogenic protein